MAEYIVPGLFLALGIVLVVKCGDLFVDAAIWLSEVTGIPRFVVGATVVSVATTLPELLVSLLSTRQGLYGMAVGNAVGSVSCNLGLILGISLVVMPAAKVDRSLCSKGLMMLLAAGLLLLFGRDGLITLAEAALLTVLFGLFLWENIRESRRTLRGEQAGRCRPGKGQALENLLKFLCGILGIVVGAQLMVDNGSALARLLGVPDSIIGVTLLAVGTSLPELITTLTALARKEAALSVGNVLGANVIDLLLVPAVCALSAGHLTVLPEMAALNIPMALLLGALTVVPALLLRRFQRLQGVALLAAYGGYLATLVGALC